MPDTAKLDSLDKSRILDRCKRDEKTGCLLWQGAILNTGYGQFSHAGEQWSVHRAMFYLCTGILPDGAMVCHRCDVRNCCEPTHLFLGDSKSNMADAAAKGRMPSGDRNHRRAHPECYPPPGSPCWSQTEKRVRGEEWAKAHAGTLPRGDDHYLRRDPEKGRDAAARLNAVPRLRGEQHPRSKLTEDKVKEMKELRSQGTKLKDLAQRFGVSISTVSSICQGKVWARP